MVCDDLCRAANHDAVNEAFDPNLPVAIGNRD